jgi:hypothetical protein
LGGRGGGYDDDVRLEAQAVGGEGGKPLASAIRREVVDGDGLRIHIAEVAQALEERLESRRRRPRRTWIKRQQAELRDSSRPLRIGGERCKHKTENDREPDPPHGAPRLGWLAGV